MNNQFLERSFWIELRKRTRVYGRIGIEECSGWCDDALKILKEEYPKHGFRMGVGGVSAEDRIKYELFVNCHRFLYTRTEAGIFIADGTAGQINRCYKEGYYKYLDKASRVLRLFYEDGLEKKV